MPGVNVAIFVNLKCKARSETAAVLYQSKISDCRNFTQIPLSKYVYLFFTGRGRGYFTNRGRCVWEPWFCICNEGIVLLLYQISKWMMVIQTCYSQEFFHRLGGCVCLCVRACSGGGVHVCVTKTCFSWVSVSKPALRFWWMQKEAFRKIFVDWFLLLSCHTCDTCIPYALHQPGFLQIHHHSDGTVWLLGETNQK